ncbi:MAG: response regulator [Limisphaerales bacterium]
MSTTLIDTKQSPSLADLKWPGVDGQRPRILFAEDDSSLRRVGELVLLQSGYSVHGVADGADAWAALNRSGYDLLITDNEMPRLTGMELVRKLQLARMNVPVILTSGTFDTLPSHELSGLECSAMLAKPFTFDQLLLIVREVLRATVNGLPSLAPQPPAFEDFRPSIHQSDATRSGINE